MVERTHHSGLFVTGSDAVFSGSVVRDVEPDGTGSFGRGIAVQPGPETNERANVQVIASVIERAHDAGVYVSGSDVELVGTVVRDVQPGKAGSAGRGVSVQADPQTNERSSLQLITSVIERAREIGVNIAGSDAVLSGVVVRDILPEEGTGWDGRGLQIQDDAATNERATVRVTASVVERTHDTGVVIAGADAELSGVVVRDIVGDILPDGSEQFGRGIQIIHHSDTNQRASVQVTASMVERIRDVGVLVHNSDAQLVGVVVRDVLPNEAGLFGGGVAIQNDTPSNGRSNVRVTASLVERAHTAGVFVKGSSVEIAGVVVRDVLSNGAGLFGDGIFIRDDIETNERSNVQITASVVERAREVGVFVAGSDVEIMAVVVRDILPNGAGLNGEGVYISKDVDTNERAAVNILASLIERNNLAGVVVVESQATIEGSIVQGTSANEQGQFGDGIVVLPDGSPSQVAITGTIVDSNARAGLVSFGAPVRFSGTVLSCNAFDLQGEVYDGSPFSFPDSHDNICGCPATADACNAVSVGLSAPAPLEDLPGSAAPSEP